MPELIIQSGKLRGKKLVLPDTKIVIGRDEECEIRLASSDVSRRHCQLQPSADGLRALDLGSRNGSFVNDVAIQEEVLLKPGDVLRVGPMAFQVPVEKAGQDMSATDTATVSKPLSASDDDIANWLTGESAGDSAGDTTIISSESLQKAAATAQEPAAEKKPEKKKFKSIADEAADIIRRHWEQQDTVGDES